MLDSRIQCKDQDEVEKVIEILRSNGFISKQEDDSLIVVTNCPMSILMS